MHAFTQEHEMVRKLIRRWTTSKLEPRLDALEAGEPPYELMREFVKVFGMADLVRAGFAKLEKRAADSDGGDVKLGGMGSGDPALGAAVAVELSRVSPGFALAFGATMGLAGGAIMAKGTLEQKKRWALPILTLDKIGAWGMTEPGAGSDAFRSMRTVAVPRGDGYVLSGQKTFITNAPYADVFVVYAKIDRGDDTAMEDRPIQPFILERTDRGLETSKPMRKMGMHSSPTGELFLADCAVPADRLLGLREPSRARREEPQAPPSERDPSRARREEPQAPPSERDNEVVGRASARDVFHGERTGMAPMCVGIIERCLEIATDYAKQRVTWGRRIADYQLVQDKLARMFMHLQNCENLMFKQLALAAGGKTMTAAEASATKLYCARAATECALDAVQVLGGNGYMQEYRVEMLARDAKLLQIGGGTDEIQIINIARHLLASDASA